MQSVTLSIAALRQFPILAHLPDAKMLEAFAACRLVRYHKGDSVVAKGRDLDHLCFLLSGKLQVLDVLPDGTEFGLHLVETGQFFGELHVIDRQHRSASVVALTSAAVAQMQGETARRLLYENPRMSEAMMRHLAYTIRQMSELRALQAIPHAPQRVYALLRHLMREGAGGLHVIEHAPTHSTMAIMVNTSRETVSRSLAALKSMGVIQKDLRRLIVRQPDILKSLIEAHQPVRGRSADS